MKIDLEVRTFANRNGAGKRNHYVLPGSQRTLCGVLLDDKQRPTGDEPVGGKCLRSRRLLAERGGL